jgi:hypothetical protein
MEVHCSLVFLVPVSCPSLPLAESSSVCWPVTRGSRGRPGGRVVTAWRPERGGGLVECPWNLLTSHCPSSSLPLQPPSYSYFCIHSEMGSFCVAQARLKLLAINQPSASTSQVAGTTNRCHLTWLILGDFFF